MITWTFPLVMYAMTLISSCIRGEQLMFYLLLALIPFIFACWVVNSLLSGKDLRDISKHLTLGEKKELTRQARSYGSKIGIFLVAPLAVACGCLYAFGLRATRPYIALLCLFMIILVALLFRQSEKKRVFMYSTDYGVKLTNRRIHSVANPLSDPVKSASSSE